MTRNSRGTRDDQGRHGDDAGVGGPSPESGYQHEHRSPPPSRRPAGQSNPGMPAGLPRLRPPQPERLRRERRHLRIEVEHHGVVAFQPGLIADMPARRRRPPPSREMPLPGRPAERADRNSLLEPRIPAGGKQLTATLPFGIGELRLDPSHRGRPTPSSQRLAHRHISPDDARTDRTTNVTTTASN